MNTTIQIWKNCNRDYHENFRKEYVNIQKDVKGNAVFKSETVDADKDNNLCTHGKAGCGGLKKNKTTASKNYLYAKETTGNFLLMKEVWLMSLGISVVEGLLIDFLVTKMKKWYVIMVYVLC